jgi:phospholipid/cholesterol/gamma-HCH transport system substrate-binding protein
MKRTNDLVVGTVVLACIIALVGALLWVQQLDVGQRRTRHVARFRDVGNARVGSAVVIRGVQSGRIESIELAEGGWVLMRLRLDQAVALPRDPVVLLNAASLFGEWQATITSNEALPLNPDVRQQIVEARGERDVLPGAMVPDIAQLTAVAGGIAGNVASVAERFKVAFDDTAAAEFRGSIANVARLSAELERTVRRQSRNVDSVALDVHRGMEELRSTAEAFRRVAERFDSSTEKGEVRSIVRDLTRSARELESAAVRINQLSQRVDGSLLGLDRVLARTDSALASLNSERGSLGMLLRDPSLYRRTDSLMVELHALVSDIRANPRRYFKVSVF